MIKKETKTRTETITRRLCDFCEDVIRPDYDSSVCHICGRDVCYKHRTEYREPPDYYDGGDYPDSICLECDKIVAPFFKEVDALTHEYEPKVEEILKKMKKSCKENAKRGM